MSVRIAHSASCRVLPRPAEALTSTFGRSLTVVNAERGRVRETGVVLIVRGTKKVLDRIGGVTASDSDRSTTRLGDWYVNVLFWKPQVALFVNEVTLLPVVMPFAPASTLLARFPATLHTHLQAHGVGRDFVEVEFAEMNEVRTAKTASRSVLGVMNEFKFLAEVETQFVNEHDLLSLSLRLAETPCGPLYKRHISPDHELAAIVGSHQ